MNPETLEAVSAAVHNQWMATTRAHGIESARSQWGEEQMVPYADLSERAKDLDRGTVRAVLAAAASLGLLRDIPRETG